MLTHLESMNYRHWIRPNLLHGRWAERRPPAASLRNPRWGDGLDVEETQRRRQME